MTSRSSAPATGFVWAPFCGFAHYVSAEHQSTKQILRASAPFVNAVGRPTSESICTYRPRRFDERLYPEGIPVRFSHAAANAFIEWLQSDRASTAAGEPIP